MGHSDIIWLHLMQLVIFGSEHIWSSTITYIIKIFSTINVENGNFYKSGLKGARELGLVQNIPETKTIWKNLWNKLLEMHWNAKTQRLKFLSFSAPFSFHCYYLFLMVKPLYFTLTNILKLHTATSDFIRIGSNLYYECYNIEFVNIWKKF